MQADEAPLGDTEEIYAKAVETIKAKVSPRQWLSIQTKAIEYMDLFPWYDPRFMISDLEILISNGETADGIVKLLDDCIEEQRQLKSTFFASHHLGEDSLTGYVILSVDTANATE